MSPLLIYGATGYTGKLLAKEARDRGLNPILAGRNGESLRALATQMDLDYRVAGVEVPDELDRALRGVCVVLNAAGPFRLTAAPVIDACLRCKVHYLDISGEVQSIEAASRRASEAIDRRVMLMPAVGFDVVPSDCLLSHVARKTHHPTHAYLGIHGLDLMSRGSVLTLIDQIADPVWVRRGGSLRQIPPSSMERLFDYGSGPSPSLAVSWGDIASAYFSTGIGNVTAFFEATPAIRIHSNMVRHFGAFIPYTPWQAWLERGAELLPPGPTENARARQSAVIVAEVESQDGQLFRSRLRSPDVYRLTSQTAVEIARRIMLGDCEHGFQTPARVFGPDFILTFPGVVREDL